MEMRKDSGKRKWKKWMWIGLAVLVVGLLFGGDPTDTNTSPGSTTNALSSSDTLKSNGGGQGLSENPAPSNEDTKEEDKQGLLDDMQALVDDLSPAIIRIQPRYESEGWDVINVVVHDAWYGLEKYEKERLAGVIIPRVELVAAKYGYPKTGFNKKVLVYLVDSFGKDLATRKSFSDDYEITR